MSLCNDKSTTKYYSTAKTLAFLPAFATWPNTIQTILNKKRRNKYNKSIILNKEKTIPDIWNS